jgi:hypothetical protein
VRTQPRACVLGKQSAQVGDQMPMVDSGFARVSNIRQ